MRNFKNILSTNYFNWLLGLMAFVAYVAWLALPSRVPALGLVMLIAVGAVLRFRQMQPLQAIRILIFALQPEIIALGVIMLLAIGLRFVALSQNLPYLDNPDEPTTVQAAVKMLQTGDLDPHFFRWPSLPFYTQFLISIPRFLAGIGANEFTNLQSIDYSGFYLWGRAFSALLGCATVFVTYLTGRILYGPATGLLAALILAILPLHTEHSHYVTPDVPVTFWASLAVLFAALIYKKGQQQWYWWAGVATGLAIGTKYNVGIVFFTVILVHFLTPKEQRGKFNWLIKSAIAAVVVFLLTTPFAVLDLNGFLDEMAFQVRHYTILGHGAESQGASWWAYLQDFWNEAFVYQAVIVAIGGIGLALWRQKREDWLMLSLPALGYIFFSSAIVHFSRNLMPLLPGLCILGAEFLLMTANLIFSRLHIKKLAMQGAIVVILSLTFLSVALAHSFLTDRYYLQPDTRVQAANWIVTNIPAGAKIRLEPDTPLLPANRYQDIDEQRPIGGHPLDWYRQQGFNYLVASSYEYRDLMASDPTAKANYEALFNTGHLVAQFPGDSSQHPGPTILIYKLDSK